MALLLPDLYLLCSMSYNITTTQRFDKQLKALAKKYPSIVADLVKLAEKIQQNPECGTLLGGDVYKIRMAITSKGRGKSGGARVIYVNLFAQLEDDDRIVLISIYDKGAKDSISTSEIREALKEVDLDN